MAKGPKNQGLKNSSENYYVNENCIKSLDWLGMGAVEKPVENVEKCGFSTVLTEVSTIGSKKNGV